MEGNQQEQHITPQKSLLEQVKSLVESINSTLPLDLNKASGSKYSIIQDLILWLNVRCDNKYGQINRSVQSVKSRRVVLKELNQKHVKEILNSFHKGIDLNKYQMIYPRCKIYPIDQSTEQQKAEKRELKKQLFLSNKTKQTSLGEPDQNKMEEIYLENQEGVPIAENIFKTQEVAPQAPAPLTSAPTLSPSVSNLMLRVPNISVCFVKGQIAFLDTPKIRDICDSMNLKMKSTSDKELRRILANSMKEKDFTFEVPNQQ